MTKIFQTKYNLNQGNCLTACVASLLDVPIFTLPEFCVDGEWFERLDQFCKENGFFLLYWRHCMNVPMLCLGAYIILLLELEGTDTLHAVVGKTILDSKELITDLEIKNNAALTDQIGGVRWGWKTEIVHDPNEKGYPPIVGVTGYILIGKQ